MSRPSRRGIPAGLLGMLGLVAAIECVVGLNALSIEQTEPLAWKLASKDARRRAVGCSLLCFGSSLTQDGLIPKVLERETGKKAYNLAVCAGQPASSFFLLRQAIEAGARPSAVIVDFHPYFVESTHATSWWLGFLNNRDGLDLSWTASDLSLFSSVLVSRVIRTLEYRTGVRSLVIAAAQGKWRTHHLANRAYLRNTRMNDGATINAEEKPFGGEIEPTFRRILLGEPWVWNGAQGLYVRRFLELSAAHGVRVFWVIPPFCPALQAERERKGLDGAYTEFVRLFRGFPNLVVVDARRSGYETGAFRDASHVNKAGADVLSEEVAAVVRRFDDGAEPDRRWIALNAFRPRPIRVPIEDIITSTSAVMYGDMMRR